MTSYRTRLAGACAVLVLIAGLSTGAWAADEKKFKGFGIVMARSVADGTLEIDGRSYRVSATTTFRDQDGAVITFDGFPIFDVHQGLFAVDDATKVEFVARRQSSQWVLESVALIDTLPN